MFLESLTVKLDVGWSSITPNLAAALKGDILSRKS
jgi:hypothetical protein